MSALEMAEKIVAKLTDGTTSRKYTPEIDEKRDTYAWISLGNAGYIEVHCENSVRGQVKTGANVGTVRAAPADVKKAIRAAGIEVL